MTHTNHTITITQCSDQPDLYRVEERRDIYEGEHPEGNRIQRLFHVDSQVVREVARLLELDGREEEE